MKILFFILFLTAFINFDQAQESHSVQLIDKAKLERIIGDRNDKILLINIWATWCLPCREEFPDLVKLSESYKSKIDVIALSVDYEDELNSKILPFLKSTKVNFPVYISNFKNDEQLIKFFNVEWNGALPATFIYSTEGIQIKSIEGKQSYESFSSILDKLE